MQPPKRSQYKYAKKPYRTGPAHPRSHDAVYEALRQQGRGGRVRILIPPARNARVRPHAPPERNRNVRELTRLGRRAWYRVSGASARARVENVFHRYKAVLGREMRARTLARQRVEARIGAKILNRMVQLAMPESHLVA